MQNKLLAVALTLCMSGCGTSYNGDAFLDKAQEKSILNKEFGSVFNYKDGKIFVVGSKQYVLNALKKMSEKHKQRYEIIWDRKAAFVKYTADKLYEITVHPGNTTEINKSELSTFETYAYIEFSETQGISPQFKQQLMDALKEEQTKHDPHEHINGVYTSKVNNLEIKVKLDQFFKKLYPAAKISTETIHGKVYTVISIRRGENAGIESFDNIYYIVKDLGQGQSQIQLHSGNMSYTNIDGVLGIVPKEKSQQLLETIMQKLGL